MSCGALYTRNCGCSKGSLEDKILVPKPPQNYATCGDPVDDLYCRPCAFVRKCLNKGWYTIHDENKILNTSKSSNHNTNVVSTPREPFVFNQDPSVNSSQSPLQSNHNCCYKCGDSLDDIFCQRCTCKSCGNGASYDYNCPPKLRLSLSKQCNQTNIELPQTFHIVHPTCNSGNENSFTHDSKPNFVDDSPNVFNLPPQPPMYSCEFCGNDARYGHYCTPQVPFIYPELCYNQDFNVPQDFHDLCCENCEGPHETFQCQPMNEDYYEQNSCYDHNSFGFEKNINPRSFPSIILLKRQCMALLLAEERFLKIKQVMREKQNQPEIDDEEARDNFLKDVCTFLRKFSRIPFGVTPKVILIAWERFGEIKDALMDKQYRQEDIQELMSKLLEDVRNISEELSEYINCPSWNRPTFYDNDDDEYTIIYSKPKAITPDLPIEEPDNSLNIGDEHLDTIPSIENLVPIPSEFNGISEDTCDVPVCEDPSTFDVLSNHYEILSDSNNDGTSSDDDSYENIEYIEALPLNLEYDSLEEENEDQEEKYGSFFEESDTFLSHLDNSLPEFETFSDHTKETRSGSTTTHANNSLSEYDSFLFEVEPDQEVLTSIVISDKSNNPLLELPEFELFHFDLDPSFPRPPPEPPDVEISLIIKTDAPVINNFDELNKDECFDPGGMRLMLKMTIPSHLSFRLFFRFSPTLQFLLYFPPPKMRTPFLTSASPLRAGGISSGWNFHVL
ncbi:hypothetical protein Tco_0251897 [Tanacetum coccineum]